MLCSRNYNLKVKLLNVAIFIYLQNSYMKCHNEVCIKTVFKWKNYPTELIIAKPSTNWKRKIESNTDWARTFDLTLVQSFFGLFPDLTFCFFLLSDMTFHRMSVSDESTLASTSHSHNGSHSLPTWLCNFIYASRSGMFTIEERGLLWALCYFHSERFMLK